MKAVVLYGVTALVTGLYSFYRIMSVVNGEPVPLLNLIAAQSLGAALFRINFIRWVSIRGFDSRLQPRSQAASVSPYIGPHGAVANVGLSFATFWKTAMAS
jgi:hypothetical protein